MISNRSIFSELSKSVIIYGLASALNRFLGFLLLPIYTRVFKPSDYGTLDIFNVLIYFLTIFSGLEVWGAVAREYMEVQSDIKKKQLLISTGFWQIVILSFFLFIILGMFSSKIQSILSIGKDSRTVLLLSLFIVPFATLYSYFNVLMRFEKRPWFFLAGTVLQLIFNVLFTLIFVFEFRFGITSVFLGQLLGYFIVTTFFYFILRKYIILKICFSTLRKLLFFSLPLVPAVIAVWLNSYSNRFFMLKYLSLNEIGIYAVALKISSIFLFIEYALRLGWTPILYEIIKENNYQVTLIRIYVLLLKILGLIFIFIAIFSKEIILLLVSYEYLEASKIAALMCIPTVILILNLIVSASPSISKKTIFDTLSITIGFSVNIFSLFFTIPNWGMTGAAISYVSGSLVTFSIYFYFSKKLINLNLPVLKSIIFILMLISFSIVFAIITFKLYLKIIFSILLIGAFSYFSLTKDKDFISILNQVKARLIS